MKKAIWIGNDHGGYNLLLDKHGLTTEHIAKAVHEILKNNAMF